MQRIESDKFGYDKNTKTFKVNGIDVRFDTSYELVNKKTGGSMTFSLSHSTGSEWDPNTKWIYKNETKEFTLEVGNEDVTPAHAQAYLEAKLR